MKNLKKKGFTITELVIVIAVIAILAAVLIPTFTGLVGKAKDSVALQESRAALNAVISEDDIMAEVEKDGSVCYIVYNDGETEKWYKYESNQMVEANAYTVDANDLIYTKDGSNEIITVPNSVTLATAVAALEDLTENVAILIAVANS